MVTKLQLNTIFVFSMHRSRWHHRAGLHAKQPRPGLIEAVRSANRRDRDGDVLTDIARP